MNLISLLNVLAPAHHRASKNREIIFLLSLRGCLSLGLCIAECCSTEDKTEKSWWTQKVLKKFRYNFKAHIHFYLQGYIFFFWIKYIYKEERNWIIFRFLESL